MVQHSPWLLNPFGQTVNGCEFHPEEQNNLALYHIHKILYHAGLKRYAKQEKCFDTFQKKIVYFKWFSINRFSTHSRSCRIPSLHNEVLHHSMKYCPIVVTFHTKLQEVPTCFGCLFRPQLNVQITS